jgi:GNAT superfamily N-acetyltransferase
MQPADIASGDRLRALANWNQTPADWARVLSWEPGGCFVAEQSGAIVGTVSSTVFGVDLAWIGMMLVDPAARRQGIARRLLSHALEWLEGARHVRCVGLDATPLGKTLYDSMGFRDAYTLQRWEGTAAGGASTAAHASSAHGEGAHGESSHGVGAHAESSQRVGPFKVRPLDVAEVGRMAGVDRCALGVDRLRVVRDIVAAHARGCFLADREGDVLGYACSRPGARRWYVGPVVARDPDVAAALLTAVLAPLAGQPVVMDILDSNARATAFALAAGWQPVRPFIRMARGGPLPSADLQTCIAIVGPEVG